MTQRLVDLLALLVIMVTCLAPLLWYWYAQRRSTYKFNQYVFMLFNLFLVKLLWRATVSGPLPISLGQGAVIVANHRSPVDPPLIHLASDRIVHWMIASEYWKIPVLGWFFRFAQCIPVSRAGTDTAATKMAIRYAQRGELMGMFPEGRINTTNQILESGRPGAALVALKARVPVVPVFIHGAPYDGTTLGSVMMTAKAHVVVGRPIDISAYYGREREPGVLQELTKLFLVELARLGGVENFQPRLAGRRWKPGMEEPENHKALT